MDDGARYVETREVPLAQLTRFEGNAKRGDVDVIAESIRTNGQYRSLVVRAVGDALVILAGNHTYDALAAIKAPTARCEIVTCDDLTARRINLVDNRSAELGSYDTLALLELLSHLDGDYAGTGWTQDAIDDLLAAPPEDDLLGGGNDPEPGLLVEIEFDNEVQRQRWDAYLDWLSDRYPNLTSVGERLHAHLGEQDID